MTREALEAALALWDHDHEVIEGDLVGTASLLAHQVEFLPLADAARKQLALMPEKCTDDRHVGYDGEYVICPTCHGWGKVYKQETVDRLTEVWRTLWDRPPYFPWKDLPENHREHLLKEARIAAIAVLDAINGLDQEN